MKPTIVVLVLVKGFITNSENTNEGFWVAGGGMKPKFQSEAILMAWFPAGQERQTLRKYWVTRVRRPFL